MMRKAKTKKKKITLALEEFKGSELQKMLQQLLADLSNAPDEVRKRSLDFFEFPSELVSLECGSASGTSIAVLLKPSQALLDLCVAVRAGNLDFLLVEHPHGFSSVGSGLVELPILSTLEKLPIAEDEIKE